MSKPALWLPVAAIASAACAHGGHNQVPSPLPPWRCYSLSTDSSPPVFVPHTLVLGQNRIGSGIWKAAAIKPDRLPTGQQNRRLGAWWRSLNGDSVQIEWYLPRTVFGPEGLAIVLMTPDSLIGRVAHGSDLIPLGPWVTLRGHSVSCAAGA